MTTQDEETVAAKKLAWQLYLSRLGRIVTEQFHAWDSGHPALRLCCDVPTAADVDAIRKALTEAGIVGSTSSLDTLTRALDAIDDSKSKHATVKAVRAELQALHDELRSNQSRCAGGAAMTPTSHK